MLLVLFLVMPLVSQEPKAKSPEPKLTIVTIACCLWSVACRLVPFVPFVVELLGWLVAT